MATPSQRGARARTLASLCLVPVLAGCASTSASSTTRSAAFEGGKLERSVGDVRAGVREDGYQFVVKLSITGCQQREVPVQLFGPMNRFIGQEIAVPPYESTSWAEFRMFVPDSRIGRLRTGDTVQGFVVDPDDPARFIGTAPFTYTGTPPEQLWEVTSVTEQATLDSGETGVVVDVSLEIAGHVNEVLPLVVVLQDLQGEELRDAGGTVLRLTPTRLSCPYETSVWRSLKLEVPYSRLAHLPLGSSVVVRPSVEKADGVVYLGNVSVTIYSGGSLDAVLDTLTTREQELDREVRRLEQELTALGLGGGQ